MANVVGIAACPECGEAQEVYFDTHKYYIKCTSCYTFINYQSKTTRERILNRLEPVCASMDVQDKPLLTTSIKRLTPIPARETHRQDDFLVDSYGDWL